MKSVLGLVLSLHALTAAAVDTFDYGSIQNWTFKLNEERTLEEFRSTCFSQVVFDFDRTSPRARTLKYTMVSGQWANPSELVEGQKRVEEGVTLTTTFNDTVHGLIENDLHFQDQEGNTLQSSKLVLNFSQDGQTLQLQNYDIFPGKNGEAPKTVNNASCAFDRVIE